MADQNSSAKFDLHSELYYSRFSKFEKYINKSAYTSTNDRDEEIDQGPKEKHQCMKVEKVVGKVPMYIQICHVIPLGWKRVDVAGSFSEMDMEGGGGFVLRDWDYTPTVAQSFPARGHSQLFVEAYALYRAMKALVRRGEEKVAFCVASAKLFHCFYGRCLVTSEVWGILKQCVWWAEEWVFRVVMRPEGEFEAASWLAVNGRRCQQRCRWHRASPWPPGLDELLQA